MSEEHSRTPLSVRGSALDLLKGRAVETMTLGPITGAEEGEGAALHPDFLARAAIWRDHTAGLISISEARRRSEAIGAQGGTPSVAASALVRRKPRASAVASPRHARPAPRESRQYSGAMATTAARDDRLTPNAKAFLQVLRARCGKTRQTAITKGTMGAVMARSARTIRRYLVDLVRCGYIQLAVRRNARGLDLGLTVTLTDLVMPFYEDAKSLARWLAETPSAEALPFAGTLGLRRPRSVFAPLAGVTKPTHNNQSPKTLLLALCPKGGVGALNSANRLWRDGQARVALGL
ncbi:hypothetical protein NS226_05260 [Aureimonas ureilytica]|uniref:Uncharacterized protein n=1 Tax=Aureimonas ureilytica TaxID=401562 RepID=A0A175RAU2_9HYPH|nr:hypothetical protein [Aureimonas ureilytica]KTQ97130.1 hypothetical protein NS226_05260 [Aureimonas ureilytica]